MNHAVFIGNLTAEARSHLSADGKEFVTFDIAINQKRKDKTVAMYVSCYKSGANAHLLPYLAKGQKVCVMGSVSVTAYASRTGESMAKLTLYVNELELVGGRALVAPTDIPPTAQPNSQAAPTPSAPPQKPNAEAPSTPKAESDTDDLPF